MKLSAWFDQTGTRQNDFAERTGLHPGRVTALKAEDGWPASQAQALAIARETGFRVLPNDFVPDGAIPKRRGRAATPRRNKDVK
jgi:hypothetical protein